MIQYIQIILLIITVSIFPNNQLKEMLDNYIYGPYLNDPEINLIYPELSSIITNNVCDEQKILYIDYQFSEPGRLNLELTEDEELSILQCSWNGNKKAVDLLEKVIYAKELTKKTMLSNVSIRKIIYNPEFILHVGQFYPRIFQSIPDSHPQYITMALRMMTQDASVFDYITLRYKSHPKIIERLFYLKDTYDDIYKHIAIQNTHHHSLRKDFIMHNGLLYAELPEEIRSNPYLSYRAYVQNDNAYEYIPERIRKLFKKSELIKIPKYWTEVQLIKQDLAESFKLMTTPIIETIYSWIPKKEAEIEIEIIPEEISSREKTVAEIIEAGSLDKIPFKSERTVVTDKRVINKIENLKKRRLMNLWRISTYGDDNEVYVALFRPQGKQYLGSIVIKHNNRVMFSDYAAVFSLDGESIWRVNDKGDFSGKSFIVDSISKNEKDQLNFEFTWIGEYTNNQFRLIDEGGLLVRGFINYYFE